ncbi:hypothetical protein GYMLUDRAFT_253277 [Collybiopsis luxurians FD-317 M1]|uniref:Uncharacterized protein n=1 Tax=Collybiopsis luxurians FD-317 M1 TaxID=944289 RepID=A0A0D0B7P3_9AGAR|nr:hypothetical protein GYMLUDRAFT_253277 [Collybiopsis luxurians FD-317 M1]
MARYPAPASNILLADVPQSFDPECVAEVRCLKEKLVIKKTKELLQDWIRNKFPDGVELGTALAQVPQLDVLEDLDKYTSEFLEKLDLVGAGMLKTSWLIFKPLRSDRFSIRWKVKRESDSEDEASQEAPPAQALKIKIPAQRLGPVRTILGKTSSTQRQQMEGDSSHC